MLTSEVAAEKRKLADKYNARAHVGDSWEGRSEKQLQKAITSFKIRAVSTRWCGAEIKPSFIYCDACTYGPMTSDKVGRSSILKQNGNSPVK